MGVALTANNCRRGTALGAAATKGERPAGVGRTRGTEPVPDAAEPEATER
ncbi:hypothetical protein [Streptomyces sp. NPDC003006]